MAEPVYISVNPPNIITIMFIVVFGWTIVAAGIAFWRKGMGGSQ